MIPANPGPDGTYQSGDLFDLFKKFMVEPSRDHAHTLAGLNAGVLAVMQNTTETLQTTQETVARLMQEQYGTAAVYDAFNVTIPAGGYYEVLPFDLSRLKAKIVASAAGTFIGSNVGQVQAGSGFPLQANTTFEVLHTQAMWFGNPTGAAVTLGVYIEKSAH